MSSTAPRDPDAAKQRLASIITTPRDLPVGTFLLLRDLISERLGMWFDESKKELLASKLGERADALNIRSFLEYFYRLKYDHGAEDEWLRLTETLSVQETYFFREIDQIRALVDVLLPRHLDARPGEPVRIWSAACATGEEPLTIAMALDQAGWFERVPIELWASDVSAAALARASAGIYRERAFRALPPSWRERYFRPVEGGWQIDERLRNRVTFRPANLLEPGDFGLLATSRYIFCRNVFIYFSPAVITNVVRMFAARMPRPAYLFVGVSESLLRLSNEFELEQVGGAFVYVKS